MFLYNILVRKLLSLRLVPEVCSHEIVCIKDNVTPCPAFAYFR